MLKDVASFLFAWGLIYQQVLLVPPGQADGRVLTLAGALLGVPGLSVLLPRILAGLAAAGNSSGMTGQDSERAERP